MMTRSRRGRVDREDVVPRAFRPSRRPGHCVLFLKEDAQRRHLHKESMAQASGQDHQHLVRTHVLIFTVHQWWTNVGYYLWKRAKCLRAEEPSKHCALRNLKQSLGFHNGIATPPIGLAIPTTADLAAAVEVIQRDNLVASSRVRQGAARRPQGTPWRPDPGVIRASRGLAIYRYWCPTEAKRDAFVFQPCAKAGVLVGGCGESTCPIQTGIGVWAQACSHGCWRHEQGGANPGMKIKKIPGKNSTIFSPKISIELDLASSQKPVTQLYCTTSRDLKWDRSLLDQNWPGFLPSLPC